MIGYDLVTAARGYAAHGWRVFPLAPGCKTPLHERAGGFLEATADVETVAAWWDATPAANIGLHPGPSGLVIVDIDGPQGEESARDLRLLDVPTASVTTGRVDGGRHLYFQHPGFPVGNRALAPHLDVRADKGYVVLPPSVHPSGSLYTWGAIADIAPLPPAARERLGAFHAQQLQAERSGTHEGSHARILPVPAPSADFDGRIEALLARIGNVNKGERNSAAFRVAAWLCRDFALPDDAAWGWLARWNAGNRPPLSTVELRQVFSSALKHGARVVGAAYVRDAEATAPVRDYCQRFGATYKARSGRAAKVSMADRDAAFERACPSNTGAA